MAYICIYNGIINICNSCIFLTIHYFVVPLLNNALSASKKENQKDSMKLFLIKCTFSYNNNGCHSAL